MRALLDELRGLAVSMAEHSDRLAALAEATDYADRTAPAADAARAEFARRLAREADAARGLAADLEGLADVAPAGA